MLKCGRVRTNKETGKHAERKLIVKTQIELDADVDCEQCSNQSRQNPLVKVRGKGIVVGAVGAH